MTNKTFKDLVADRNLKLGTFLGEFATNGMGLILANAGLDFVFIDQEHSGFSLETVKRMVRIMREAGVAVLVRPPSADYHDVSRLLDVGGLAVMPPMMTLARARRVIGHIKYPPDGHRGAAFGMAHDLYQPGTVEEKVRDLNKATSFIALIETVEGLADVEAIAELEGVDGLFIGHLDLSLSLGIGGQFDHPEFLGAIDKIAKAAKTANISLGRMAMTPQDCATFYHQGFDIVMYSGDIWVMQTAYTDAIAAAREHVKTSS
ncbi:MAG: HpcH/HpaI aldolase family protein [Alphaproteobacteria bacterium]